MMCAVNRNQESTGEATVNGVDIGEDLPGGRIGQFAAVVAEDKHERLTEALLNDTAERSAINIDPRLAPDVIMAELQRGGAAERMPEHTESLHIQSARKLAGRIGGIKLLQLAHHK